ASAAAPHRFLRDEDHFLRAVIVEVFTRDGELSRDQFAERRIRAQELPDRIGAGRELDQAFDGETGRGLRAGVVRQRRQKQEQGDRLHDAGASLLTPGYLTRLKGISTRPTPMAI